MALAPAWGAVSGYGVPVEAAGHDDRGQPRQLRKGPKAIPRAQVDEIQRNRIRAAVVEVCADAGYRALSVDAITAVAGMSRRTFYELFHNKDEAFLSAFDRACSATERIVLEADAAAPRDMPSRVIAAVGRLTTAMADHPAVTQMCLVEAMAAGNEPLARREQLLQRLAELVTEAATDAQGTPQPPPMMARTIVGGIYDVIHATAIQGALDHRLTALVPDFVYALLVPYLGADAAEAGRRRALDGSTPGRVRGTTPPSLRDHGGEDRVA